MASSCIARPFLVYLLPRADVKTLHTDWIPAGLPRETKLQLRYEMGKPISSDDTVGYIYIHEMASKGEWVWA